MKKISLLLVIGVLCISLSSLAGELITNDTGDDATGLRVVFSALVKITAFGDILTDVDPEGTAIEFVFSGRMVSPWGSHWLSWTPSSAKIISHEWLAGSTSTLQGLPVEQRVDRPVLTGNLLNPDYFIHPAYVMQGITKKDAVFAMPLDGVEQLAFYPVVDGVDLDDVTWSVEVSHPEGIGASIEGKTLYIWGSNTSWAGYGSVTLEATVGAAVGSVTIPVTVFREDKTLINAEGEKDYFVPWSPDLDINRIVSVEEHMRTYDKDEENLDRSVQFSSYRPMPFLRDIAFAHHWYGPSADPTWTDNAQRMHITCTLEALSDWCIDTIRVRIACFMDSATSSHVGFVHERMPEDPWKIDLTISMPDLEYLILEAHRLGINLFLVPAVMETDFGKGDISPANWPTWFADYEFVVLQLADTAQTLGAEFLSLGELMIGMSTRTRDSLWNQYMLSILAKCREAYLGPIVYIDQVPPIVRGGVPDWERIELWNYVDVIGCGTANDSLASCISPSLDEVMLALEDYRDRVLSPLLDLADKPFLFSECGISSMDGALWRFHEYVNGLLDTALDLQEQRLFFEAVSEVYAGNERLRGFGWFGESWIPWLPSSISNRGLPFLYKPAGEVVADLYCHSSMCAHAFRIDGEFDDWTSVPVVADHPDDAKFAGPDLLAVQWTMDAMYAYVSVTLSMPLTFDQAVAFDLDLDADGEADIPLHFWYAGDESWGCWVASMAVDMQFSGPLGYCPVQSSKDGTQYEARIPLRMLGFPTMFQSMARLENSSMRLIYDHASQWHICKQVGEE